MDGNIQFNLNCAAYSQIGVEPDYALSVIGSLIADQLLIPILRDQMGAYSVFCGADDDDALYLISYRDPNVKATFDLYDSIPEKPQFAGDHSRLAPGNFFAVNGDHIDVQTTIGGTFALLDLNGTVLFKTKIKTGLTTLKIPAKAQNKAWIATLNGKMMNR